MAFIRQVEVTIGPKGGNGKKIDGLKIGFTIEKTDKPEPNTSKIQIYNLSAKTHNEVCITGNHCTLKAGYKDEKVTAIFFGDVVKGTRAKSGNDYITELEVKDGRVALFAGQVSVSYAKDTDVLTIVQDMISAIGLSSKGTDLVSGTYPGSYSGIGQANVILQEVLNKLGLRYTIQNEMIYILNGEDPAESTGLKLTAESGLLTIPQPLVDKTTESDTTKDAPNGWSFRTLLFPELIPGASCEVESSTLNGVVRITKTVFTGDNWDGEFIAEIEGVAV
jgi:hypothetical protein